ncbi:MAG: ABC transporter permease [Mycoplasmataceae bacterium]|nr:ABC transporter permease [Mycoplasmataceae bacterium]
MGAFEPTVILPNIACVSIILIGGFLLPNTMVQYRLTQVIRRIKVSKKDTLNFYLGNIACFAVVMFVSYFLCLSISTLMLSNVPTVHQLWLHADWYGVIYSLMVTIAMSLAIGFYIGYLCNSVLSAQVIGMFLFLFSLFFGFMIFSMQTILMVNDSSYNPFILMSYIWPYRYTSTLFNESFLTNADFNYLQSSIFDLIKPYLSSPLRVDSAFQRNFFMVGSVADKYLDLIMPWAFVALIAGGTAIFKLSKFSSKRVV